MVLLKRMAFKGRHKFGTIQRRPSIMFRGNHMWACQFSGSLMLQGKVKWKLCTKTCYYHLEAASRRILKMWEVNKMLIDLQIASWQSLMMVFKRIKLCWQILNPWVKVMQSMYSVYKLCSSQVIGLKLYGIGKIFILAPIMWNYCLKIHQWMSSGLFHTLDNINLAIFKFQAKLEGRGYVVIRMHSCEKPCMSGRNLPSPGYWDLVIFLQWVGNS